VLFNFFATKSSENRPEGRKGRKGNYEKRGTYTYTYNYREITTNYNTIQRFLIAFVLFGGLIFVVVGLFKIP
jgi:hypothetical protein